MTYPQPPWSLQGYAVQTLHLLDIERVRPFIPSELEIISVWPGKTLGGIYVAFYDSGSALIYNELIVVSALTRYQNRFGAWISHIYVDNPDSVAGGREIWGLPKELAEFTGELGQPSGVHVHQGDQLLCRINLSWRFPQWRLPLTVSSFSVLGSDLLFFEGQGELGLCLIGATVQVPPQSPFSSFGFEQPWLSFCGNGMRLSANAPKVVGENAIAKSNRKPPP